jgi:hypothetical protein
MPILSLRILPPFAIARFGSSSHPLEAFRLEQPDDEPLGFRKIVPEKTLEIDTKTGAIVRVHTPKHVKFRDGEKIRPVAPFLEIYAQTSDDTLEPLTLDLLKTEGLGPDSVHWSMTVANRKAFRQTRNPDDQIVASINSINDHDVHELQGKCKNFLQGKYILFGNIRYIRPTVEHPEIRLRFTPAAGLVYGSSTTRLGPDGDTKDPVFKGHQDRIVYDTQRGSWRGFQSDINDVTNTNPSDIYQGYAPDPNKLAKSWGYLDDVCDGPVSVELTMRDGQKLSGRAWVSSAMPAFAPDSQPVRTVADDIEQLVMGPKIGNHEISYEAAADIVRRGLETVRLMNTRVMNGNIVDGRINVAHTLVTQDSNDVGRAFAPIIAHSLVDNLAVRSLHQRVFAALQSGTAPWFAQVLRTPEEVGDLSDKGRRKMPPMLRGADSRALALTRRQIDTVEKAATFRPPEIISTKRDNDLKIEPRNKTAQLLHRAVGNPSNTLPSSAISNCFPGLEFDFKAFWRRAFVGIVLQEWDNYVIEIDDPRYANLKYHRLLKVDGMNILTLISGPYIPGESSVTLGTQQNPSGTLAMEWSNALAFVMRRQGESVKCHFTFDRSDTMPPIPDKSTKLLEIDLVVRKMFDGESVAPAEDLLRPGELTQGLCSPWQHDYRECACYYWPASRPDYVNVEPTADGLSSGDMWLSKERTGEYILDDRKDTRLVTYDELFQDWEGYLRFQVKGHDAEES